jgi:hypothetical protein
MAISCRQQDDPLRVIDPLLHDISSKLSFLICAEPLNRPSSLISPGADMMGEIRAAPRAAERMEAELFTRLYGWQKEQSLEHDRTGEGQE